MCMRACCVLTGVAVGWVYVYVCVLCSDRRSSRLGVCVIVYVCVLCSDRHSSRLGVCYVCVLCSDSRLGVCVCVRVVF